MKLLSRSAVATIALALASAAQAQDKPVQLKFSHWVPPTHPMHAAAVAWAESIDKASNGSIKITIFPAQQLGKAFDHYNMGRDGITDISHVNPGYEPGRFPIVGAAELPFVFANGKEGSAALDAWYRRYAGQEMKDVRYCLSFAHDPGTLHFARKKVVAAVTDPKLEITLPEARRLNAEAQLEDEIEQELAPQEFGRIAAQTAKQVIFQKVREAERDTIFNEYNGRVGEMLNCTVKRTEPDPESR